MPQHPKVTVGWAVACLERALEDLGESAPEARVRKQFHQLVLALERDGHVFFDRRAMLTAAAAGKVLAMPARTSPLAS
jgi:hypothetical protein